MAIINGWGRGTWDEGAWGTALPVTLTSVGAITSGLGSVTVTADANHTLTTLAITSGLGTTAKANVTPTTLVTTSALGSVIVHENEVINLTGFQVASGIGAVTTTAAANVTPTGVSFTASTGSILVFGQIDTDQSPGYSAVATTQTPSYTEIDAGRDAA